MPGVARVPPPTRRRIRYAVPCRLRDRCVHSTAEPPRAGRVFWQRENRITILTKLHIFNILDIERSGWVATRMSQGRKETLDTDSGTGWIGIPLWPIPSARCQWQAKTAHYWQLKIAHFGGVRRWGTEAGRANRHGVRALCGVSIAVRNCAHSSRIARCRGGRAAPEPRSPVDVPSELRAGRRERSDRMPARSAEGGGPGHGAPPSSSGRACSRS